MNKPKKRGWINIQLIFIQPPYDIYYAVTANLIFTVINMYLCEHIVKLMSD
ncbi:hypothetical protein DFQ10_1011028 [Winogradskyella eximia]|jgi:hypothetical protein|uniref:Uncharacterized protein n=1 Tax=Winogradskyella eximia TaxID=262006 RepID=A0A3D9HCP2_9FLAO|nr:hypothetical protein DFQ10_1011028 [Winogradskyella eximia]